jgi:hypothetical protein
VHFDREQRPVSPSVGPLKGTVALRSNQSSVVLDLDSQHKSSQNPFVGSIPDTESQTDPDRAFVNQVSLMLLRFS